MEHAQSCPARSLRSLHKLSEKHPAPLKHGTQILKLVQRARTRRRSISPMLLSWTGCMVRGTAPASSDQSCQAQVGTAASYRHPSRHHQLPLLNRDQVVIEGLSAVLDFKLDVGIFLCQVLKRFRLFLGDSESVDNRGYLVVPECISANVCRTTSSTLSPTTCKSPSMMPIMSFS